MQKHGDLVIEQTWVLRTIITVVNTKEGFFSESAIRFSNLQISKKNIQKNYPELEIAFQAQDSFWNIFILVWRFEKQIALSVKQPYKI